MKFNLLKKQQKQTKNKEKSRGRSMVEMLGVLAIIGVLSIGGIQGYTMAMRKYRANEILSAYQKYAVNIYTSAQQKLLNDEIIISNDARWREKNNNYPFYPDNNFDEEARAHFPEISLSAAYGIRSTNSGDFVLFSLLIKNKTLCETIINITGETAPSPNGGEQCLDVGTIHNEEPQYRFYLSFLMN